MDRPEELGLGRTTLRFAVFALALGLVVGSAIVWFQLPSTGGQNRSHLLGVASIQGALPGVTAILALTLLLIVLFHLFARTILGRLRETQTALFEANKALRRVEEARAEVEEALEDSEERFEVTFEQAAVGMAQLSPQGRILHANRLFGEIVGYPLDELAGVTLHEITSPEDEGHGGDNLVRVLNGEICTFSTETKCLRKDGSRVWILLTVSLVRDDLDEPDYFVCVIQDISDRKVAEEELGRSRRDLELRGRIQNLFLTVSDDALFGEVLGLVLEATGSEYGVFGYVDEDGSLIVPPQSAHLPKDVKVPEGGFGLSARAADEISWTPAVLEKRPTYSNHPGHLMITGGVQVVRQASLPILDRGQVVGFLQIANKPADYGEDDLAVLGILSGHLSPLLTARLQRDRAERARARAEAELQESVELLARSNSDLQQFAYVASHDLQEPLRMVASFTQLLADRYRGRLDAEADEFIEFAVDGANRMQELIQGLLRYSRVETQGGDFVDVDTGALLEEVLLDLGPSVEEHGVRVVVQNDLPTVFADPGQLGRVFLNLIGNALKFSPSEGGEVKIGVDRCDGEWRFRVEDNGMGIEPVYFERIFGIFQRLNPRGEHPGTGMGLPICKRILERHKGRIWLESVPGSGTTFFFTLPDRRLAA